MDENDCELTVRRFFTHYLEVVFPEQLEAAITGHNKDVTAHTQQIRAAVKNESMRLRLWVYGLIFTGGLGGGLGLARFLGR